jgi:hypothetical protein
MLGFMVDDSRDFLIMKKKLIKNDKLSSLYHILGEV